MLARARPISLLQKILLIWICWIWLACCALSGRRDELRTLRGDVEAIVDWFLGEKQLQNSATLIILRTRTGETEDG